MIVQKRKVTEAQIRQITRIINRYWRDGLDSIAREVCLSWKWKNRQGEWKIRESRLLLRSLKKNGYIKLPLELKFRGRTIRDTDVKTIKDIIKEHKEKGRVQISKEVCAAWNWTQKNGIYQDQVCRTLLLMLEKMGYIELPPRKRNPPNNAINRDPVKTAGVDPGQREVELTPEISLRVEQVRREAWEKSFDGLLERFHHLGYRRSPGAHLKYVVFAGDTAIACASFCSAPRNANCHIVYPNMTDSDGDRRSLVNHIIFNDRFLVLPWVRANGCIGTIVTAIEAKVVRDWQLYYRSSIKALEAYVEGEDDAEPYRQAGWARIGEIRGIDRMKKKPLHATKEVYVKVIEKGLNS